MPKHEWSPFLPCLTVTLHILLLPLSLLPYKTKTGEMFTVILPVWFSCLASLSYLCLIITVLGKAIGMSVALFRCNLFRILSGAVFGVANRSISSSSLTVIVGSIPLKVLPDWCIYRRQLLWEFFFFFFEGKGGRHLFWFNFLSSELFPFLC